VRSEVGQLALRVLARHIAHGGVVARAVPIGAHRDDEIARTLSAQARYVLHPGDGVTAVATGGFALAGDRVAWFDRRLIGTDNLAGEGQAEDDEKKLEAETIECAASCSE
jgi:hypothetical protein